MKARIALGLAVLSAAGHAAEAGTTLCAASEVVAFSCSFGEKQASLCASPDLGREVGTLFYRFGTPGRVELAFPKRPSHPKENFRLGSVLYAGGGGEIVKFQLGPYTYSIYESFGGGNDPSSRWAESGLTVRHNGRLRTHLKCRNPHLGSREEWASVIQRSGIPQDAGYSEEP